MAEMENYEVEEEEVVDDEEEYSSGSGLGLGVLVGLAVAGLGTLGYKKVVKPFIDKRKAKKESETYDATPPETDGDEAES